MLLVPMKTHLAPITAVALLAAFAPPVAAEDAQTPGGYAAARLEARIAELEARVSALEAEKTAERPAGEAILRVAFLADSAMRRLVDMVRELKREPDGEDL